MPFVNDVNGLFSETRRNVETAAAGTATAEMSDELIAAHAGAIAARLEIKKPRISDEPETKERSTDKSTVKYVYNVENPQNLIYYTTPAAGAPTLFGKWDLDIQKGKLTLMVSAIGREAEQVKAEAQRLLSGIRDKVTALAGAIDGFNRTLIDVAASAIRQRRDALKEKADFESKL